MARIVEDIGSGSDDEFPSLEELATRGKAKAKAKSAAGKVKSPVKRNARMEEPRMQDRKDGDAKSREEKARPKKRVLNQKSDNPLLRPFDSASSELLGEGSRRKGRAVGDKVGKKSVVKVPEVRLEDSRFGIDAEMEEQDENTAQPINDNPIESIEADDCDIKQIRKTKTQTKTARTNQVRKKVDEVTREARTSEGTSSTPVESIKSEAENFSQVKKPARNKEAKKRVDEEKGEAKSSERSRQTPVESNESEDEDAKQIGMRVQDRQARKAVETNRARPPPNVESDEEDFGLGSDGMSEFIVNDSTFLEEEDSVIEEPAPRSIRRLVKGRKFHRFEESEDEGLDLKVGKPKIEEDAFTTLDRALKELDLDDSDNVDLLEPKTKKGSKDIRSKVPKQPSGKKVVPASSDIEDPFTLR
jgi:hypothetical protein